MFLSIVIATYNRSRHLKDSLEAWAEQDFTKEDFEIIVVNNGSTDDTEQVCLDFERRHPEINFQYVFLNHPCLSCARNKGIELSSGDYITFVDDDARPEKHYIANFKRHTSGFPGIRAFGGRVLPHYETGKAPEWMSRYLQRLLSFVDLGNEIKIFDKKYPVGCNMLFRKDLFEEVGMFDIPAGYRSEDKHFFLKVKRAGNKVLYLPDVTVYHFIDAWRLTGEYVVKTSCKNGCSDRIMYDLFPHSYFLKAKHFTGLGFKLLASMLLWAAFALRNERIKGKYLFLSMWHTTRGFLRGCKRCEK